MVYSGIQGSDGAFELLMGAPYFSGLDPAILTKLANAAVLYNYEPDQILFFDDEATAGLFIVQQGWLKTFKHALSGREQVIRFLGPGDVFNVTGVLADGKNLVTAKALEASLIWLIKREVLLRLMEENPPLAILMARNLARQVYRLLDLIEDLSLRCVEGRVANMLLDQALEGVVIRRPWFTQTEIASRCGTVQGVVNRVLHKFVDQGLIRIDRRQIYILDTPGLQRIALQVD